MFLTSKLTTFFIETPLGNSSGTNVEPYVIAFVILVNSFTKFRVRLNVPPIVFVSLNFLNFGSPLTL